MYNTKQKFIKIQIGEISLKKKLLVIPIFLLCIIALLSSLTKPSLEPIKSSFYAFDTVITLTGYGKNSESTLNDIQAKMISIENTLSKTLPSSIIYKINHANGNITPVNSDVKNILTQSLELSKMTNGAFDITIGPAEDLWGFTSKNFHVPADSDISAIKNLVDMSHLHLTHQTVQLDPASEIDLGGIAKGYALEEALNIAKTNSLAGGIVNLGGDILAFGTNIDHKNWNIAIQDPNSDLGNNIGILSVANKYIVTSGGYERYFEENGIQYQHIIDPLSCAPAKSTLKSVTIIAPFQPNNGIKADALATAFIIMDKDKAITFWENSNIDYEMILIDCYNHVYITQGIESSFSSQQNSDYQYFILTKRNR